MNSSRATRPRPHSPSEVRAAPRTAWAVVRAGSSRRAESLSAIAPRWSLVNCRAWARSSYAAAALGSRRIASSKSARARSISRRSRKSRPRPWNAVADVGSSRIASRKSARARSGRASEMGPATGLEPGRVGSIAIARSSRRWRGPGRRPSRRRRPSPGGRPGRPGGRAVGRSGRRSPGEVRSGGTTGGAAWFPSREARGDRSIVTRTTSRPPRASAKRRVESRRPSFPSESSRS